MYGERDDPAGVLARLGTRMQAVPLPDDVLPAVVETVAQSLRLPYVAIDLADADGDLPAGRGARDPGRPAAHRDAHPPRRDGRPAAGVRTRSRRPAGAADLELLRSLAGEVGPAVQAVRLHQDLLRSRAEVVALREDERRRLRRDLHDGLGPALAAIGLKAGLAARQVPPESAARESARRDRHGGEGGSRRHPAAGGGAAPAGSGRARAGGCRAGPGRVAGRGRDHRRLRARPTGPLPAAVETAAYRIVVEALTNAVRHSGASACRVVDLVSADAVELSVARRRARPGRRSLRRAWDCARCRNGRPRWAARLSVRSNGSGTVGRRPGCRWRWGGPDDHADRGR